MCMFSGNQRELRVGQTRIFARAQGERQVLVYAMRLAAPSEVAMILPVPVAPGSGEDAVAFVDLSGYATLFDDLATGFPVPRRMFSAVPQAPAGRAPLAVHEVGAFEASYVPTLADFARVDPRFRLRDDVWRQLPAYADWGFVVFRFRPGAQRVHPMAFTFPSRAPGRLFFPTVHVHDGEVHPRAAFDHALYAQGLARAHVREGVFGVGLPELGEFGAGAHGEVSSRPAREFVDAARAAALLDLDAPVLRLALRGVLPNADTWMSEETAELVAPGGRGGARPGQIDVVVDDAVREIFDVDAPRVEHGRLIVGEAGLYFVTGWGVDAGSALDRMLAGVRTGRDAEARPAGERTLAAVQELAPEEQVRRCPGSLALPLAAIADVSVGRLRGTLEVQTTTGDRHAFAVPREVRPALRRWAERLRG